MYVNGNAAASGAEVAIVDFPAVSNHEADRIGAPSILNRGLVSPEFLERELCDLSIWAWHHFLRANGDPLLNLLSQVDGERIFPRPLGVLPDRYGDLDFDLSNYVTSARERGVPERSLDVEGLDDIEAGLRGLEETRRIDLEAWMDELKLDAIVFPAVAFAVADVAPADAGVNPTSADIGMTVGLTFGRLAYDDTALLRHAAAFEATGRHRTVPSRTPML